MHFYNCFFLQAVHDSVLDPKLLFFTDKAWFHLSGCVRDRYSKDCSPVRAVSIQAMYVYILTD
jgi:hypothetical protein